MSQQVATSTINNQKQNAVAATVMTEEQIIMMIKLGRWVTMYQSTIAKNTDNFPIEFVDPEIIAASGMIGDVNELLNHPPTNITRSIEFHEGFPTVAGVPIWERIDGELPEYYNIFKAYREQQEASGTRSIFILAGAVGLPPAALNALKAVHHWGIRAAAYDKYRENILISTKARDIRTMENNHGKAADEIFNTCMNYMMQGDIIEKMSPKEALDWFKTAAELKRLSLGLHPNKPNDDSNNKNGGTIVNLTQVNNDIKEITNQVKSDGGARTSEILDILAQCGALSLKSNAVEPIDIEPSVSTANTTNGTVDDAADEDVEITLLTETLPSIGGGGESGRNSESRTDRKVIAIKPNI